MVGDYIYICTCTQPLHATIKCFQTNQIFLLFSLYKFIVNTFLYAALARLVYGVYVCSGFQFHFVLWQLVL